MSSPEVQTESKGSVKIVRNSKGDAQWEVKAYIGDTEQELAQARELALAQYNHLDRDLG
jgi:hypothetical protein